MKTPEFFPIAEAPRDGRTLLVADDAGWRAVSHWSGDMWALGRKDEGHPIEEVEFEPTRFAYPSRATPTDPGRPVPPHGSGP